MRSGVRGAAAGRGRFGFAAALGAGGLGAGAVTLGAGGRGIDAGAGGGGGGGPSLRDLATGVSPVDRFLPTLGGSGFREPPTLGVSPDLRLGGGGRRGGLGGTSSAKEISGPVRGPCDHTAAPNRCATWADAFPRARPRKRFAKTLWRSRCDQAHGLVRPAASSCGPVGLVARLSRVPAKPGSPPTRGTLPRTVGASATRGSERDASQQPAPWRWDP